MRNPILLLIFSSFYLFGQEAESWTEAFEKGQVHGHARHFFMNTLHPSGTQYRASAAGGLIRFQSGSWKGFKVGVGGTFTSRIFSNDLFKIDPQTGKSSRWERELFDIVHPDTFTNITRLEDLYIHYDANRFSVSWGKKEIPHAPMVNKADGRMNTYAFDGGQLGFKATDSLQFNALWIRQIAPRSMTSWYRFSHAIGLANNGFQPDGTPADYANATNSAGIFQFSAEQKSSFGRFSLWYTQLHKMNHTLWAQWHQHVRQWTFGVIGVYQVPDAFQEKLTYQERLMQPDEVAQVLSFTTKRNRGAWGYTAAFTKAFDRGRFLTPRELGRDHFFTSIPRSRLDGMGNVDIYLIRVDYKLNSNAQILVEGTRINGPERNHFQWNKYNLDSHYQFNFRVNLTSKNGIFKGLHWDVLYVYKTSVEASSEVRDTNYHQLNLITQLYF